jgi:sulfonate transport system permease protein
VTVPVAPSVPAAPGAPAAASRRRSRLRPPRVGASTAALGAVVPLTLLAVWQAVTSTGLVPRSLLPPPTEVLAALADLVADGSLWGHLAISGQRVLLGFGAGTALAVLVGLLVGLSRTADRMLTPTVLAVRAVPSLAWVPLLILWAGISEVPKVALCAIGAFFPVQATLVSGLHGVDRQWLEVARANGLGRFDLVRRVLLPAAAPSLLSGMRLGLAQAWLFLVAAELIASSMGLGFLLIDSQNTSRVDRLLVAILLLAVLGKVSDILLARAERWVVARTR